MTVVLKQYIKTTSFVRDVTTRFGKNKRILKSDGEWLKHRLQDMGPTYIKIGQFMSSRRDIFDKNIVEALVDLQDNVRPMPEAAIRTLFETKLQMGKFKQIESTPIASASIGQVHRAILNNDKRVVIKVRRPDIDKMIESDIHVLTTLLNIMEFTGASNVSETRELLQDFRDYVIQETDFMYEMQNMRLFSEMYGQDGTIQLPKLVNSLSSEDMIVMEYVPSTKFSVIKKTMNKEQRSELAYRLMDVVIRQFIQDGIIHGDPHEGNIAVVPDGRLVMYDLGNIIQIDPSLRTLMKQLIFEIMVENLDAATDVMRRISLIEIRDENRLRVYLEKYVQYIKTIDVKVLQVSDKEVFEQLPVKFDGIIFRLIRVFGLIEGICKDLDPSFNYNTVFVKYMDTLLLDQEFIDYKVRNDIRSILNSVMKVMFK
jgi:ubiquinone biosynthesis protein